MQRPAGGSNVDPIPGRSVHALAPRAQAKGLMTRVYGTARIGAVKRIRSSTRAGTMIEGEVAKDLAI